MAKDPRDQNSTPAKARDDAPLLKESEPVSEQVTYRPGPEDPTMVKWAGHTFHANVPKTVTNAALIESAKGNKFFKVGAFDPAKDAVTIAEQAPAPKTSEQYRAHAVAWLKTVESVDALDQTWASEEALRMACGVGTDDIDYLNSLFTPKRAELKKRDMPG